MKYTVYNKIKVSSYRDAEIFWVGFKTMPPLPPYLGFKAP